jgi:hypothetical protein
VCGRTDRANENAHDTRSFQYFSMNNFGSLKFRVGKISAG